MLSFYEYICVVVFVLLLVDYLICRYRINRDIFIVNQYGLDKNYKVRLAVEKLYFLIFVLLIIFKIIYTFLVK